MSRVLGTALGGRPRRADQAFLSPWLLTVSVCLIAWFQAPRSCHWLRLFGGLVIAGGVDDRGTIYLRRAARVRTSDLAGEYVRGLCDMNAL